MTDRRWTVKSEEALTRARVLAHDKGHALVTTGHLMAALFEADSFVSLYLQRLGSEPERVLARVSTFVADLPAGGTTSGATTSGATVGGATAWGNDGQPPLHDDLSRALEYAEYWAEELDDEYVSAENLLLGLAHGDDDIALTLQAAGVARGGWQGVIRLRREVWQRQVQARPRPPSFDGTVEGVLRNAWHAAGKQLLEPAHVLAALIADVPAIGALLDGLGLDAASTRRAAVDIANRAASASGDVPVVSPGLHAAVTAARVFATESGDPDCRPGALALLHGLARDRGEVGELLRGVDEMLTVLADRVREPAARLAAALTAQRRAMQHSDLETAARLLHGDIPALEQEVEALGPAEAALVRLLDQPPDDTDVVPCAEYEQLIVAFDTAYVRELSRQVLCWLGEQDVPPGENLPLVAFTSSTVDDSRPVTGREAGRAAGRLALLGLVDRDEESVRLTAEGLRCLEDHNGDPEAAGLR